MAAPKARLVVKVERDDSASDGRGVMVTVQEGEHGNYGPEYRVSLSSLPNTDLMRVGANVNAGDLRSMTSEQRLERIESIVKAPGYVPRVFTPKPRSERDNPIQPPAPVPASNPFPRPIESLPESIPEPVHGPVSPAVCLHGTALGTRCNECEGPQRVIEPEPVYAPGSFEAMVAEIASRVMPNVDVSNILDAIEAKMETRLSEIAAQSQVTVTIVTPTKSEVLPEIHHAKLAQVISYIARGHNVYLAGPAGTGKSTMAEMAARALGLDWHTQSCNPSMMESRFFGFIDAGGTYHATEFRLAYENGGVYCLDEIDKSHPGVLAGLNQALANGGCAFPDGFILKHESFRCVATANTWGLGATAEYVGSQPVDAATLNRFARKMFIDYDPEMERAAAMAYAATDSLRYQIGRWVDDCQRFRANTVANKIRLLITPRDVIAGAIDIAAGDQVRDILANGIFAGVSYDIQRKVIG